MEQPKTVQQTVAEEIRQENTACAWIGGILLAVLTAVVGISGWFIVGHK